MTSYNHPDLHLHSTISDGSDTPLELLEKVRNSNIDIFSLTDHDTYEGCQQIKDNLRNCDPAFLAGVEFSCKDEFGKYHILGYSYNVNKDSIRNAVEITHRSRRNKALGRIKFLEEEHGFFLTEEEKNTLLKNENPGKPHFVALLMKKGYITDKKEGFAILDSYHSEERKLTPEEAIDAILKADGIPVLAHGILADGSEHLDKEEIEKRVKRLKLLGLMGLECFYSSYTPQQTKIMLALAEKYNLLVTAGSDYHGVNKPVLLGASGNPDATKMEKFYQVVTRLNILSKK